MESFPFPPSRLLDLNSEYKETCWTQGEGLNYTYFDLSYRITFSFKNPNLLVYKFRVKTVNDQYIEIKSMSTKDLESKKETSYFYIQEEGNILIFYSLLYFRPVNHPQGIYHPW